MNEEMPSIEPAAFTTVLNLVMGADAYVETFYESVEAIEGKSYGDVTQDDWEKIRDVARALLNAKGFIVESLGEIKGLAAQDFFATFVSEMESKMNEPKEIAE